LTYQTNVKYTGSQGLSLDSALELHAARLVFEDAEREGRIAGGQDAGRPIYKLREMEEKSSFDLVLIWSGLGQATSRRTWDKQDDA